MQSRRLMTVTAPSLALNARSGHAKAPGRCQGATDSTAWPGRRCQRSRPCADRFDARDTAPSTGATTPRPVLAPRRSSSPASTFRLQQTWPASRLGPHLHLCRTSAARLPRRSCLTSSEAWTPACRSYMQQQRRARRAALESETDDAYSWEAPETDCILSLGPLPAQPEDVQQDSQ